MKELETVGKNNGNKNEAIVRRFFESKVNVKNVRLSDELGNVIELPEYQLTFNGGSSNRHKNDIRLALCKGFDNSGIPYGVVELSEHAYSIKTIGSSGKASILNHSKIENLQNMANKVGVDGSILANILTTLIESGKNGEMLHNLVDVAEVAEVLDFLMFAGSPTRVCDNFEKASKLLDISDNGEIVVIPRERAVNYAFASLKCEVKVSKGKAGLVIRYAK